MTTTERISDDLSPLAAAYLADLGSRTLFDKPLMELISDLEHANSPFTNVDFENCVNAGLMAAMDEFMAEDASSGGPESDAMPRGGR